MFFLSNIQNIIYIPMTSWSDDYQEVKISFSSFLCFLLIPTFICAPIGHINQIKCYHWLKKASLQMYLYDALLYLNSTMHILLIITLYDVTPYNDLLSVLDSRCRTFYYRDNKLLTEAEIKFKTILASNVDNQNFHNFIFTWNHALWKWLDDKSTEHHLRVNVA